MENIKTELDTSPKYVDKQLIKPPCELIMYRPPGKFSYASKNIFQLFVVFKEKGTGKSGIMSKLAVKLGIAIVGPPLAARELNHPLVGESERILIVLCQRCYRIPYAMCCVSIDEIDSLAPKRAMKTRVKAKSISSPFFYH